MSKKQIAALNRETEAAMAKAVAKEKEDAKVNLKNCARESGNSKTVGSWDPRAKPTEEECRPYIAQIEAITDARINHAANQRDSYAMRANGRRAGRRLESDLCSSRHRSVP